MSASQITLQEVLHISEAKQLQEKLIAALKTGDQLTIDAANVERADTASIQLLLAAKKTFDAEGVEFSIENMPEGLTKSISSLGLTDAF